MTLVLMENGKKRFLSSKIKRKFRENEDKKLGRKFINICNQKKVHKFRSFETLGKRSNP